MVRFFSVLSDISDGIVHLSAEDAAHIRSLRLRPDELFTVCDGGGVDYICRLGERNVCSVAEIIEAHSSRGEPSVACSVYIAYAKGDRLDYAVQKSVELGASDIVLFPSDRCVAIPDDPEKKVGRLQRIALETAKQCGRGRIPVIIAMSSFGAAIRQATQHHKKSVPGIRISPGDDEYTNGNPDTNTSCSSVSGLSLFFYECEEKLHLKQVLEERSKETESISIVTGPEGGFEPHEAEFAQSMGLIAVSLGPRILRCETAPVAALAAIMFSTGNL